MVSVDQITRGIASYADREIVGKMQTGTVKRLIAGAAVALALQNTVSPFLTGDIAKALGIYDGNNVDIDALAIAIKDQIPEDGIKVNVPGIGIELKFKAQDVDDINQEIVAV